MKTFIHSKILIGASCALLLAACDSVKDVPNENFTQLPAETVVLSGQINGLSSLRAVTLQNNNDTINTRSVINAAPSVPNEGIRPVPFSFGAVPVGSPYNITVKDQPDFKNCVVVNGQGVITLGARPDIVVNCTTTGTRYNLTVNIPTDPTLFKGLEGAKVRVTTEEEIREVSLTSASPSQIVFNNVLITAPGALNPATYSVTASTFEGNRLNKCVVTLPSGTNPTGPVSNVVVGAVAVSGTTPLSINATTPACQFTVGGRIAYSLAPGQTTYPAIAGLRLQLRDLQMNTIQEIAVPTCTPPANAGVTNTTQTTTLGATVPVPTNVPAGTCEYTFTSPVRSSSTDGLYEVGVAQHPVGQFCLVVNGASVSVFTQGLTPPVNVTNANVFCRATPAANRQIRGVFRLQTTTFVSNAITNAAPLTSEWRPFDLTQWNTASSNMMAFFENGTFLYGAHGNTQQAEHGFYDYDPATQRMRFTSIVDTNPSTVFPATFSPFPTVAPTATFTINTNLFTTTPGLSALPNPIRQNGPTVTPTTTATASFAASHAAMTGVTFGTVQRNLDTTPVSVRTISGTFGADPAGISSYAVNTTTACSTTAPCLDRTTGATITSGNCTVAQPCYMPNYAYRVSWVLEEPPQIDNELTGAWLTQDSRRLFVYDYRTYFGYSVGMLGGSPSLNDACFSSDDLHESKGIYTRRASSGVGCFPYARPANDATNGLPGIFGTARNGVLPGYLASQGVEAVDFNLSATPLVQLPGYTGRFPGGETFTLITSPSPIYFQIAPAASFFSTADATYFPPVSTSWCTTQILGLRTTANGFPTNYPVYYCRTRATLPN